MSRQYNVRGLVSGITATAAGAGSVAAFHYTGIDSPGLSLGDMATMAGEFAAGYIAAGAGARAATTSIARKGMSKSASVSLSAARTVAGYGAGCVLGAIRNAAAFPWRE